MKRPAGVIVSIVLLALGSVLCAAMVALMLFALGYAFPVDTAAGPASPEFVRIGAFFVVIIFGATALWQFITAFGLWRMKRWGRFSLLSFSGVMVTFQAMGLAFLFLIPMPPMGDGPPEAADIATLLKAIVVSYYVIPIVIGIWWLIYFNRAAVKAQFSGDAVHSSDPQRPVSIVTIGWFFVTTAVLWPVAVYWELPAVFLWMVFTGWGAMVVNTLWCIVMMYAGVGLLRWELNGYRASVGLLFFGVFNMLVFYLVPGSEARMLQIVEATRIPGFDTLGSLGAQPSPPPRWLSIALALLSVGIPLWFLHANRGVFVTTGKGPTGSSKP